METKKSQEVMLLEAPTVRPAISRDWFLHCSFLPDCPGQVKYFKMAEGQVKIRVSPPYMAGKISKHKGNKSNLFSTVQIKLYSSRRTDNWYQYSSYRKVTFYVRSITPFAGQVKIVSGR